MRSTWSGHLGFGLVQVPIKLFKATASHDVGFNQHCPGCQGRVGLQKYCKDCSEPIGWNDPLRGTEVDGKVVFVSDDELASLEESLGKQMVIEQMVNQSEIDPLMFESSYYIGAPDGAKAYALLAEVMAGSGLVAIARFTYRKTKLAAIRAVDGRLVLHTLLWPDEIREAAVPGLGADFSAAELKAATLVVESMVDKFDPSRFTDSYQTKLRELVAAKAEGETWVPEPVTALDTPDTSDLLAQLQASIKRHPAGKKRTARKAPARRKTA